MDGHPVAEPMTRELDAGTPTPEHAVGTRPVLDLELPYLGGMAAHAAPLSRGGQTGPETPPHGSKMSGIFLAYV